MEKRYSVNKKSLRKAVLALLMLILAIIFIRFAARERVILEYSSEYVAMAELPSQLSFTYYEEAEWKDKITEINGGKNLNGKLTVGKLEKLLKQLSVQEYVTCPKGFFWKQVSRSEWNDVYEQIRMKKNRKFGVILKIYVTLSGSLTTKFTQAMR